MRLLTFSYSQNALFSPTLKPLLVQCLISLRWANTKSLGFTLGNTMVGCPVVLGVTWREVWPKGVTKAVTGVWVRLMNWSGSGILTRGFGEVLRLVGGAGVDEFDMFELQLFDLERTSWCQTPSNSSLLCFDFGFNLRGVGFGASSGSAGGVSSLGVLSDDNLSLICTYFSSESRLIA